jgi:hypothetical protein
MGEENWLITSLIVIILIVLIALIITFLVVAFEGDTFKQSAGCCPICPVCDASETTVNINSNNNNSESPSPSTLAVTQSVDSVQTDNKNNVLSKIKLDRSNQRRLHRRLDPLIPELFDISTNTLIESESESESKSKSERESNKEDSSTKENNFEKGPISIIENEENKESDTKREVRFDVIPKQNLRVSDGSVIEGVELTGNESTEFKGIKGNKTLCFQATISYQSDVPQRVIPWLSAHRIIDGENDNKEHIPWPTIIQTHLPHAVWKGDFITLKPDTLIVQFKTSLPLSNTRQELTNIGLRFELTDTQNQQILAATRIRL